MDQTRTGTILRLSGHSVNTRCRWLGKWSKIILRDTRIWSKSSFLRSVTLYELSSTCRTWRILPGRNIGGCEQGSLLEVLEMVVVVVEVVELVEVTIPGLSGTTPGG